MTVESPFVTNSRIINEPSNAYDDLHIIATSGQRLDPPTRAIIAAAADELQATQRLLVMTQVSLIETQQRLIAVNDQLLAARKATLAKSQGLTASFGSLLLQSK